MKWTTGQAKKLCVLFFNLSRSFNRVHVINSLFIVSWKPCLLESHSKSVWKNFDKRRVALFPLDDKIGRNKVSHIRYSVIRDDLLLLLSLIFGLTPFFSSFVLILRWLLIQGRRDWREDVVWFKWMVVFDVDDVSLMRDDSESINNRNVCSI